MNQKTCHLLNLILVLGLIGFNYSCKEVSREDKTKDTQITSPATSPFFKISLAQWSLNKPMQSGDLDPQDFAKKAREMGFDGIEYVSQLYTPQLEKEENYERGFSILLDTLKARSERYNIENVLIMVDGEGDLATTNVQERNEAVENHKKWVDAANYLGAHSIRVNLFGSDDPQEWKTAAIDGLQKLSHYAVEKNVNVLVENHGGLSSNARLLAEVINGVSSPNCGTLPDFGNFCIKREGGDHWETPCIEEYPRYQGVQEMMPYAKAVSAKSYEFDEDGRETSIDYGRMLQIVKDAGYTGYIGIEYEGDSLSPEEGIIATRDLLIAEAKNLNP